jgi:myo-inositol-1(or 4)-monophosphatase
VGLPRNRVGSIRVAITSVTDIDSDPESLRAVAEGLAAEAAEFVRRRRTEVFGDAAERDAGESAVRSKSSPTDPVTIVDTETERLLRDRLAVLRPGDPILGEEGGGAARVEAGRPLWVLDPIDGTVNFVYGIEGYAVSVGVQIDGASVAGAVANVPTGEVFSAAVGHGAHVRRGGVSTSLRCTAVDDLAMALVGTGFGYAREQRIRQAEVLARLLPDVRDVRRLGSCALDLCMVAAGRMDAYFEDGVHVWDWAAGALIAAEAGAQLILPPVDGGESDLLIVAAAPGIAEEFEAALRGAGAFE